jgi:dihydrofolate reductase
MRKIINSTYMTLDGVVQDPHLWPSLGRPSDERATRIVTEQLLACDAVLMGRRTYEGFAPVWPTRSGDPYSDRINAMPKYVVSTTLTNPGWANTRVIARDVVGALRALKESPGQDVIQYGFGPVSRLMLEHDLLDEVHLWVHPLILGRADGELPFAGAQSSSLDLAEATALSDGQVILSYRVGQKLETAT